jgi:hypothetical protein
MPILVEPGEYPDKPSCMLSQPFNEAIYFNWASHRQDGSLSNDVIHSHCTGHVTGLTLAFHFTESDGWKEINLATHSLAQCTGHTLRGLLGGWGTIRARLLIHCYVHECASRWSACAAHLQSRSLNTGDAQRKATPGSQAEEQLSLRAPQPLATLPMHTCSPAPAYSDARRPFPGFFFAFTPFVLTNSGFVSA